MKSATLFSLDFLMAHEQLIIYIKTQFLYHFSMTCANFKVIKITPAVYPCEE
jgi:hypothetical protein